MCYEMFGKNYRRVFNGTFLTVLDIAYLVTKNITQALLLRRCRCVTLFLFLFCPSVNNLNSFSAFRKKECLCSLL